MPFYILTILIMGGWAWVTFKSNDKGSFVFDLVKGKLKKRKVEYPKSMDIDGYEDWISNVNCSKVLGSIEFDFNKKSWTTFIGYLAKQHYDEESDFSEYLEDLIEKNPKLQPLFDKLVEGDIDEKELKKLKVEVKDVSFYGDFSFDEMRWAWWMRWRVEDIKSFDLELSNLNYDFYIRYWYAESYNADGYDLEDDFFGGWVSVNKDFYLVANTWLHNNSTDFESKEFKDYIKENWSDEVKKSLKNYIKWEQDDNFDKLCEYMDNYNEINYQSIVDEYCI